MFSVRQIDDADVAIAGSSLAACRLAVGLAGKGLRVTVAGGGASLAPEITATLRAWHDPDELPGVSCPVGRVLRDCARDGMFHLGELSEGLEDLLIEAGVRFFYQAQPVGIACGQGRAGGAVVAGKFGVALISAPLVVDCTEGASLARAAGAPLSRRGRSADPIEVRQVVQYLDEARLSGPDLRSTAHGPFVEVRLRSACSPEDPFFTSRVAMEARRALATSAAVPSARPLRFADLPILPPLWRLDAPATGAELSAVTVPAFVGFLVVGAASAVDDETAFGLARRPERALRLAADLEGPICGLALALRGGAPAGVRLHVTSAAPATAGPASLRLEDPAFREPGVTPREVEMPALPVVETAGTVVCGGGTSGVTAAAECARAGADTLCLEAHGDLGGVNTVGGVPHYWFGHWSRYMVGHYLELKRFASSRRVTWSAAQLAMVEGAGARVLPLAPIVGAAVEGRRVTGVVVATEAGLAVVRGERFIDTTGDADVAAWAGAPCTYGSERDETTLWCSFGKFRSDRRAASRLYYSVVDQRSAADSTRAIIAGRRQVGVFGEGEFPQFAMATRESRHVRGRSRLGYVAMIAGRRPPDTVAVFRSNVDIKGMAASDAAMCGFVEQDFLRNWKCGIPYGSLLPEGLDNVLVAGKAYSASHDALAMARMQADVAQMGAAAGLAAALAAEAGALFRELEVGALQRLAAGRGLLEPEDLAESAPADRDAFESLADRLLSGPIELDEQMLLLAGGRESVAPLQAALEAWLAAADGQARPLVLARCLCALGDRRGAAVLLPALAEALESDELPALRTARHHDMPDHGWAPDPVFFINALALAGEPALVPLLARLEARLAIDGNLTDHRFNYVHAVAYALERLAAPQGVPILESLLRRPALRDRVLPAGSDPRRSADHAAERCAYLELSLGRALARCGSPRGYRVLIAYLADQRLYLARSAFLELLDLSGCDFGFDGAAWLDWLASREGALRPLPYDRRLD